LISRVKKPRFDVAIVAHRGGSRVAPENTLPAFRSAIATGSDFVELDVQLTADDKVVVHHDRDTERLGGTNLTIARATYEELSRVRFENVSGGDHSTLRIPLLEEVLSVIDRRAIPLIEIKRRKKGYRPLLEQKVVQALREREMIDRAMVVSFHRRVLHRVKNLEPRLPVGLLSISRPILRKRIPEWISGVGAFRKVLTRRLFRRLKSLGRCVFVWTVNEEDDMEEFAEMGVDGIVTDDPALLKRVLSRRRHLAHS